MPLVRVVIPIKRPLFCGKRCSVHTVLSEIQLPRFIQVLRQGPQDFLTPERTHMVQCLNRTVFELSSSVVSRNKPHAFGAGPSPQK